MADVDAIVGQLIAHRDQNLRPNDVDARYFLRNRVLNLNPGVDFDKENVLVFIDQKLDRARVGVVNGPAQLQGVVVEFLLGFGLQSKRRSYFDYLLKPPLHRAVSLVEVNDVAVLIAQKLHLDVLRVFNEFL